MARFKTPDEQLVDYIVRRALPNPEFSRHRAIFNVARFCRANGATSEQTFALLRRCSDEAKDREIPDREIWSAIKVVYRSLPPSVRIGRRPDFPPPNEDLRRKALSLGIGTQWWLDHSLPTPDHPFGVLQRLFKPTEFVCLGESSNHAVALRLEDWGNFAGLPSYSYMTPNPMIGMVGLTSASFQGQTDEDVWFPRTDLNVLGRRFVNVEFDHGNLDDQAAWTAGIACDGGFGPVVISWSGSRSLHSLFYVGRMTTVQTQQWFGLCTTYGADPALWCLSQYCRLPLGFNHKTGQRQTIVYWAPYVASSLQPN